MANKVIYLAAICLLLPGIIGTSSSSATISTNVVAQTAASLNVELVGSWSTHNVLDLSVYGSNAYVSRYFEGPPVEGILSTVDISNPAQPNELDQLVATYDEVFQATYAELSHIYVAEDELDGSSPQLTAYSNDDLTQIECFSSWVGTRVVEMWSEGGYWYVVSADVYDAAGNKLRIYRPEPTGTFLACKSISSLQAASQVTSAAYTDNNAYLGTIDGNLWSMDISSPEFPTAGNPQQFFNGSIDAVAAAAGSVYLAQGATVKIVDVSDPASPSEVISFINPVTVTQLGVAGEYLYAAYDHGLHVYDIHDRKAPTLAGTYMDAADQRFGTALFLANGLIYTGGPGGMNILRFTQASQSAVILEALGPGVVVDGTQINSACGLPSNPPGYELLSISEDCPEVDSGAEIDFTSPEAKARMYLFCMTAYIFQLNEVMLISEDGWGREAIQNWMLIEAHVACEKLLQMNALRTSSPVFMIEHVSGDLRYSVLLDDLPIEVETDTTAIQSDGTNDFGVRHDAIANETTVRCYNGSVILVPNNPTLPPISLSTGQQVEITSESVAPVTEIIYQAFVPLVVGGAGPAPVSGWTTILQEDFEDVLPDAWSVVDNQDGYGEYYWARRSCQAYTGNYSGWAVGGGVDGSTLDCGSSYPDNVRSQMISSAFSLADATAADMTFQRWHNTDSDNDRLFWGASTDGFNFNGWEISGDSGGWQQQIFDLTDVPNLGDLSGQPIVWIMIGFISDSGVNHPEGAYVDDVVLRKFVPFAGQ